MGLSIIEPKGCYSRISLWSGLYVWEYNNILTCVIDNNCRFEIILVLFDHSEQGFEVR